MDKFLPEEHILENIICWMKCRIYIQTDLVDVPAANIK